MRIAGLLLVLASACTGFDPDLVGEWRHMPSSFDESVPLEQRERYIFQDDGTVRVIGRNSSASGRFETDGRQLRLDLEVGGDTNTITTSYAVAGDRLVLGAMHPIGEVDGVVGRWTATYGWSFWADGVTPEPLDDANTIEFAADGTVRELYHYVEGVRTEGTWQREADSVEAWLDSTALRMRLVDGVALGQVAERIED